MDNATLNVSGITIDFGMLFVCENPLAAKASQNTSRMEPTFTRFSTLLALTARRFLNAFLHFSRNSKI